MMVATPQKRWEEVKENPELSVEASRVPLVAKALLISRDSTALSIGCIRRPVDRYHRLTLVSKRSLFGVGKYEKLATYCF